MNQALWRKMGMPALALFAAMGLQACGTGSGGGGGGAYYDDTCDSFYDDCSGSWDDSGGWDNGGGDSGGWDDGSGSGGWDDGGGDSGGWDGGGGDTGGGDDGTYCDGFGFCYSNGNRSSGRDVVSRVGEAEMAKIKSVGQAFAKKFQMSEDTGVNVARAFYDWKLLAKKRTRTPRDVQAFTKRLYGVEFSRITQALTEAEKGQMGKLDDAIDDAADHWGTTPETMKEVLKDWYKDVLKDHPQAK